MISNRKGGFNLKLVYGVVIFSAMTVVSYVALSQLTQLHTGVLLVGSFFIGGLSEWYFYRRKR